MKIIAVAANIAILAAMIAVYVDHVHAAEVNQLRMQIQIEKTVAQALLAK